LPSRTSNQAEKSWQIALLNEGVAVVAVAAVVVIVADVADVEVGKQEV
jgi:hypothetical protein